MNAVLGVVCAVLGLVVLAAAAFARIGYVLKQGRKATPPTTPAANPLRTRRAPEGRHLYPPADRT